MLEFMPYRACEPVLNAFFSAASTREQPGYEQGEARQRGVRRRYRHQKRFHPRAQAALSPSVSAPATSPQDEGAR